MIEVLSFDLLSSGNFLFTFCLYKFFAAFKYAEFNYEIPITYPNLTNFSIL